MYDSMPTRGAGHSTFMSAVNAWCVTKRYRPHLDVAEEKWSFVLRWLQTILRIARPTNHFAQPLFVESLGVVEDIESKHEVRLKLGDELRERTRTLEVSCAWLTVTPTFVVRPGRSRLIVCRAKGESYN